MTIISQIVVDQNGLCHWFFDSAKELAAARTFAAANSLAIIVDDEMMTLPAGEILTSAYEFCDFYSSPLSS